MSAADEAYDRLHGLDGHRQADVPCPACGGSMRFCECMDDPFAPAGRKCQTCGCGSDGDGDCPCGCIDSEGVGTGAGEGATGQDTGTAWVTRSTDCPEAPAQAHPLGPDGFTRLDSVREAFALGAAWALGDDEETPTALREQLAECELLLRMATEARDRAERQAEAREAVIERALTLADEWDAYLGRARLVYLAAADELRAALNDEPNRTQIPVPIDGLCRGCGHRHTPDGCAGPPTPSDAWAGVSPAACDCDAEVTD